MRSSNVFVSMLFFVLSGAAEAATVECTAKCVRHYYDAKSAPGSTAVGSFSYFTTEVSRGTPANRVSTFNILKLVKCPEDGFKKNLTTLNLGDGGGFEFRSAAAVEGDPIANCVYVPSDY